VADAVPAATRAEKRGALAMAGGLLGRLGGGSAATDAVTRVADRAVGKSAQELAAEELALGPALAANVLAAAPLWDNRDAQQRVNRIGRWLASQTSRPELPWTFAVIDDADVNAYAAPGGYVLVTRGLYELLADDSEVAAVLAHELVHVVQRDHYEVIRRQQLTETGKDLAMSQVRAPGPASYAKDYVDRHGAAVLLSGLDRGAEYHADHAAAIYLARGGFEPLALYSVLQKMSALGERPARMSQLVATHPPLDDRLDRLDAGLRR
jgi:predicted Zn-dependent protease